MAFDGIEFGRVRWQEDEQEVLRDHQFFGHAAGGTVEDHDVGNGITSGFPA